LVDTWFGLIVPDETLAKPFPGFCRAIPAKAPLAADWTETASKRLNRFGAPSNSSVQGQRPAFSNPFGMDVIPSPSRWPALSSIRPAQPCTGPWPAGLICFAAGIDFERKHWFKARLEYRGKFKTSPAE
jgi:hypothetical protein